MSTNEHNGMSTALLSALSKIFTVSKCFSDVKTETTVHKGALEGGVAHPLKVLSPEEEALPALPDPVHKASLPLVQSDLTDFSVHSSSEACNVTVLLTMQFLLQQRK